MKYRSDFVTNSSSSSFIVVYNTPEEMIKDIRQFVKKYALSAEDYDRQYKDVVYDIFSKHISYTELEKKLKGIVREEGYYKLICDKKYEQERSNYVNQMAWRESSRFNTLLKEYVEKEMIKFKNKVNPKGYFAYLEYSNSDGYYDVERDLEKMLNGVYKKRDEH